MVPDTAFTATLHLDQMFTYPSPLAGPAHVYPHQYSQLCARFCGAVEAQLGGAPSFGLREWLARTPSLVLLLLLRTGAPTELLPWPQFQSGNPELSLCPLRLLPPPLPL